MLQILQVVTLMLVAVTMTLALAHALEYPGKMRLSRQEYLATQAIYYPGFTLGGIAEGVSVVALGVLAFLTRGSGAVFWLTLAAFLAVAALHAVYWLLTHPVNNFWVKDVKMHRAGTRFFGLNAARRTGGREPEWTELRDQWERSHLIRAALGVIGLLLLTVSLVI
ncbi:MAG TPA: anthrone oxygenase family protein [Xanthobacteraceae bacterium]|nr:anthrone oxygenase family protein [Xanthobacteraceae bacterium]